MPTRPPTVALPSSAGGPLASLLRIHNMLLSFLWAVLALNMAIDPFAAFSWASTSPTPMPMGWRTPVASPVTLLMCLRFCSASCQFLVAITRPAHAPPMRCWLETGCSRPGIGTGSARSARLLAAIAALVSPREPVGMLG